MEITGHAMSREELWQHIIVDVCNFFSILRVFFYDIKDVGTVEAKLSLPICVTINLEN